MKHLYPALRTLGLYIAGCATLIVFHACRSSRETFMTEKLFLQYARPNIEYPHNETAWDASHTATEIINRPDRDTDLIDSSYAFDDSVSIDTSKVYRIDEVRIQARSSFAPSRNGKVGIDFLIRIPKELLSDNFRFTLTPEINDGKEVHSLADVVLHGSAFRAFQEKCYAAYEEYLAGIVPEEEYDKNFLDHKGVASDIRLRQDHYLSLYRKEWAHRQGFEKWSERQNERYRRSNLKRNINHTELYHNYGRKITWEQVKAQVKGTDTTGIAERYYKRFNRRVNLLPHYYLEREANAYSFPKKYRPLFLEGENLKPITNSIALTKHRYLWNQLEENKQRKTLADKKFTELVPYPYLEESKVDTLFNDQYNFFYLYHYEHPITKNLKNVLVTLKSRVDATDKSSFVFQTSDTLNFLVSSIESLADPTLATKKKKMKANAQDNLRQLDMFIGFPQGRITFNPKDRDNKEQLEKLMAMYKEISLDPNTAIDSVVISARTSLEGAFSNNLTLTKGRAKAVTDYLMSAYGLSEEAQSLWGDKGIGEDWVEARKLIRRHPDLPQKEDILKKIARVTRPDQTETELSTEFKASYAILKEEIYPQLRRVRAEFFTHPTTQIEEQETEEEDIQYTEALLLLQNREYEAALDILRDYADYNTALCLLSMGHKESAYHLLSQLEQTADVHYLTAITLYQLNRKSEAAGHLLKACELDPDKLFRVSKDAEIKALVREFNLRARLDEIGFP